jgi:hypothetical protein
MAFAAYKDSPCEAARSSRCLTCQSHETQNAKEQELLTVQLLPATKGIPMKTHILQSSTEFINPHLALRQLP